jgi:ABC-type branched-subunit amino acid transport system permease subunit
VVRRYLILGPAVIALLVLPPIVRVPYLIHLLILTCIYIILALSYDLVVGHVGALALGHPGFFGIGAYASAILSTRMETSLPVEMAVALVVAAASAFLVGIPAFRLSLHSFAIGTLGFAFIAQTVANNWIDFTRGPMCISGIPQPDLFIPGLGKWQAGTLTHQYYYILCVAAAVTYFVYRVVNSRVGRAFHAVRDDEALAASKGISPLRYKMTAFVLGAALAGLAGAFWARYMTIVCPTEMSIYFTIDLLVIIFIGGAGSIRGVILGAVIVAFIPEMLRITPNLRLIIYGAILLVIITRMPDGVDGFLRRLGVKSRSGRDSTPTSGNVQHG